MDQIEAFESEIELYLKQFCEEHGIEDMCKESQNRWNAALMYINKHVFKGTNVLKLNTPISNFGDYNNNIKGLKRSNCNAYNIDIVNRVCDIYIYLCMEHEKEVSINGFTFLTGINDSVIYAWGDEERGLNQSSVEIFKKLRKYREESLSSKLATANKNPVGILAILNRHYSWNLPGVSKEQSKRTISVAELPKLGMELCQNQTQLEALNSVDVDIELCESDTQFKT